MNAIIPLKHNRKITMRFERKTGYIITGHKRNTPQTPVEHKTTGKKYNRSQWKKWRDFNTARKKDGKDQNRLQRKEVERQE